ncbi:MAG: polysaccharide deacetylase [Gemmatimonadetes bacterium]|nr:polysaccharide deacetylase [Gemmatimonadota bacterium]
MDRRYPILCLVALAACSKGEATPSNTTAAGASGAAGAARDSSAGNVAVAPAPAAAPNQAGRIPVLEYHQIVGDKNTLYTRTAASFKADLEEAYKRGYRPISIAQMLDKNFSDVPAGMSPVVFVFDDASPSQFRYVEQNGKLEIDPATAIGIWLDFAKSHPGWKNRGTFCMLNGGAAGHNFFGDNPKYEGQKKEWRFQKVKWLADQGFELCDHTLWHMMLNKYPDAAVQEQIARNQMGIDSAVPGYKVRTIALPYGLWPKNRPLAWHGSWTDPKTGQTHTYNFEAVLEVTGGPARSPYDKEFDAHSIPRIEAIGDDIRKQLIKLDTTKTRFVVGAK